MKKIIKKLTQKFNKDEKGFTLIELIIVIAILAVIAAIAVPNIIGAIENSRKTADVSSAKVLADAVATVQATKEDLTDVTGEFTTDHENNEIDPPAGTSDTDDESDLADAITAQIQNVPKPKYKGIDEFTIKIDGPGEISVYAGTATSGDDAIMLYPTVDPDYQNN